MLSSDIKPKPTIHWSHLQWLLHRVMVASSARKHHQMSLLYKVHALLLPACTSVSSIKGFEVPWFYVGYNHIGVWVVLVSMLDRKMGGNILHVLSM